MPYQLDRTTVHFIFALLRIAVYQVDPNVAVLLLDPLDDLIAQLAPTHHEYLAQRPGAPELEEPLQHPDLFPIGDDVAEVSGLQHRGISASWTIFL